MIQKEKLTNEKINQNNVCIPFITKKWTTIVWNQFFHLHFVGKAARDMFFKVVAEEEPSVRVLSYSPGPCATDMQIECREKSADPEVKQMFQCKL